MLRAFSALTTLFILSTTLHLICIVYIITIEARGKNRRCSSPGNLLLVQNYMASIMYMLLLLVILKHPFGRQYSYLVLSFLVHIKTNKMLGLLVQKSIAVFYPFKLKRLVTYTNTKRFILLSYLALVLVYGVGVLLASLSREHFGGFITTVAIIMTTQLSATLLTSVFILGRFLSTKLYEESVNVQQRRRKRRMLCLTSAATLSMCISYVPVMLVALEFHVVPFHVVFFMYCFDQILGPLIFIGLAVDHSTWWKKLRQRQRHDVTSNKNSTTSSGGSSSRNNNNNTNSINNNERNNNNYKGLVLNNQTFTKEETTNL